MLRLRNGEPARSITHSISGAATRIASPSGHEMKSRMIAEKTTAANSPNGYTTIATDMAS